MEDKEREFAIAVAMGVEPALAAMSAGYPEFGIEQTVKKLMGSLEIKAYISSYRANGCAPDFGDQRGVAGGYKDPLAFLEAVMDNPHVDIRLRIDAAKTIMPFKHSKLGDEGKKGAKDRKAQDVGSGKFGVRTAPPLPGSKVVPIKS